MVLLPYIRPDFLKQDELGLLWIPVHKSYKLNERMYGGLQGLNKTETAAKHGESQVKIWRRAYDIRPPPISKSNALYPGHDRRFLNFEFFFPIFPSFFSFFSTNFLFMGQ